MTTLTLPQTKNKQGMNCKQFNIEKEVYIPLSRIYVGHISYLLASIIHNTFSKNRGTLKQSTHACISLILTNSNILFCERVSSIGNKVTKVIERDYMLKEKIGSKKKQIICSDKSGLIPCNKLKYLTLIFAQTRMNICA